MEQRRGGAWHAQIVGSPTAGAARGSGWYATQESDPGSRARMGSHAPCQRVCDFSLQAMGSTSVLSAGTCVSESPLRCSVEDGSEWRATQGVLLPAADPGL